MVATHQEEFCHNDIRGNTGISLTLPAVHPYLVSHGMSEILVDTISQLRDAIAYLKLEKNLLLQRRTTSIIMLKCWKQSYHAREY